MKLIYESYQQMDLALLKSIPDLDDIPDRMPMNQLWVQGVFTSTGWFIDRQSGVIFIDRGSPPFPSDPPKPTHAMSLSTREGTLFIYCSEFFQEISNRSFAVVQKIALKPAHRMKRDFMIKAISLGIRELCLWREVGRLKIHRPEVDPQTLLPEVIVGFTQDCLNAFDA
jgi:hypothetical protein